MTQEELYQEIFSCHKCDICSTIRNKVILRGNPFNPKYLFIGEAPGDEEDKQGIPFIGKSGQLLEKWIKYIGIEEKDYAITNIIKCRPPNNREPTEQEIGNCKCFLDEQIKLLNPEIIICVGKFSMSQFLPNLEGIMKYAGNFYNSNKIYLLPHPAYFLRNEAVDYSQYLIPLRNYIRNKNNPQIPITNILVNTKEKFDSFMQDINKIKFAFDSENNGLNIQELITAGLSFHCGTDKAWYIPLYHRVGKNLEMTDEIKQSLYDLFMNSKFLIGHNLCYDMQVLRFNGIYPRNNPWFDTMVAAHILDENRTKSLKKLSLLVLGKEMTELSDITKDYDATKVTPEQIYNYACADATQTYRLYEDFKEKITEQGLDDLFYNIEMPFLRCIIEMEWNGIKIDTKKLEELNIKSEQLLEDCKKKIFALIPSSGRTKQKTLFTKNVVEKEPINLNSSQQLSKLLFEELKLKPPTGGKLEEGSTNMEVLDELLDQHEIIEHIIRYRTYQKLSSSYIKSFPELIRKDGKIHCRFNDTGTVTGRLSSDKPNLQNLPNNDDKNERVKMENLDIRSCFIADTGHKLIVLDFSQQEARLSAYTAKDQIMIESFNRGFDIHFSLANQIFGLNLTPEQLTKGNPEYKKAKEKYKSERSQAKTSVFGLLYGMSVPTLAHNLKVPIATAQAIADSIFKNFPLLKKEYDRCIKEVEKKGYIKNLLGRYRRFPMITEDSKRKAFNFTIQGSGADIIRKAMVQILQLIEQNNNEAQMLSTVHDEVCIQAPAEKVEYYLKEMKMIMENTFIMSPVLLAEGGFGDNYSEAK